MRRNRDLLDIIFMGTPDFAIPILDAVWESGNNIIGVVTQPDRPRGRGKRLKFSPVKKWAVDRDIDVYQPQNINVPESVELLSSLKPDLIITAAFGQIVSKSILNIPPLGCINVHASILPKYRGASPIQQAIIDGEDETGITIMYMDEGMDTGDIILQRYTSIDPEENAESLHDRLAVLGGKAIAEALELFEEGRPEGIPQDNDMATYCSKIDKSWGEIDWNKTKLELKNFVRGLTPWPGCFTFCQGERLKIWEIEIMENQSYDSNSAPGEVIVSDEKEGLIVLCGDGLIRLTCIQGPGGKAMRDVEYLRGHSIPVGIRLGI